MIASEIKDKGNNQNHTEKHENEDNNDFVKIQDNNQISLKNIENKYNPAILRIQEETEKKESESNTDYLTDEASDVTEEDCDEIEIGAKQIGDSVTNHDMS